MTKLALGLILNGIGQWEREFFSMEAVALHLPYILLIVEPPSVGFGSDFEMNGYPIVFSAAFPAVLAALLSHDGRAESCCGLVFYTDAFMEV